jgi:DNA (cytosine-5)-methyltransferase 1
VSGALKGLSLFAGCGGLDVAAHEAGIKTLAAVELQPRFADSLRANAWISRACGREFDRWFDQQLPSMGKLTSGDIWLLRSRLQSAVGRPNAMTDCQVVASDVAGVTASDIQDLVRTSKGDLDVVFGGPPCQSFSKAGQRHSVADIRGQLFLQFARFVDELRPRWFVFENVKGVTHSAATVIELDCQSCGAALPRHAHVLENPGRAAYPCSGCDQLRPVKRRGSERRGALQVILSEFESLGYTCHHSVLSAHEFGIPQFRERLFIVGSRDGESFSFPRPTHGEIIAPSPQAALWDDPLRTAPVATVWDTLFGSGDNPHHNWPLDPDRAVMWVKNVVRPHAEPVTWDLRRPSPTIGAHQSAKLAIAPDGVPDEQIWRQQWHTEGRRQGDRPPVPVKHSYLADEDLLMLQTFPRDWFVAGTRMERAFQIGNAVPPQLGASVFSRICGSATQGRAEGAAV